MKVSAEDLVRLQHMADVATRALEYCECGYDRFMHETLYQDAVLRALQVLGDAAKHVSDRTRCATPSIPWREMTGLRDVVVHKYFGVDLDVVWAVVRDELPSAIDSLNAAIEAARG